MIIIEVLNMFCKEIRNHRIHIMMMKLKGRFKGENQPAVALCSVGRKNKEWYTYKKVDPSDTLPSMWIQEAGKGFLVLQEQREEGKHCRP